MSALPADQESRERALSPSESFHLEAPAGSGKTSVLLARFLTLLAGVEAPEEMLALTFTRKAAGELRTRVMQELWGKEELPSGAPPWERQLRELAQQVFRRFSRGRSPLQEILAAERLPVMTFHSFCAQLLRLAPQEAGVPLGFQLLEEDEARWLKQEALEEFRRRLANRPAGDPVRQALVRRLVRLNNDWPRLAGELGGLLSRRDSLGEFLELAQRSREPQAYQQLLEQRFRLLLPASLQGLADGVAATGLGSRWRGFWQALQGSPAGELLPETLPGCQPEDLPPWQGVAAALLTKGGELRKQLTPGYGFPAGFGQTAWPRLVQEIPPAAARLLKQCRDLSPGATRPDEVAALQDLVILLGAALEVYQELCLQTRSLDFIALEEAALRLLREEEVGELLLRLDYRLQHLLVDEFQDTSENQMTLLCRLLAGWQADSGRTLMVVGDPKQSIYGWRQAKVRLFLESRQGLPCQSALYPLQSLRLTTNFRSSRTLIQWANRVFADTVMAPEAQPGILFQAADPGPAAPLGEAPELALFSGENPAAAREHEARWLARQAALAVADLKEKESIGILLFTRTHLPVYLRAFQEAGLPVKVREGLKLADSRVVAHLHNLARALTRPQDALAWAGVLRGPWSPASLDTLARVAQTPGETWPEKLRRFAGESNCRLELQTLIATLLAAQRQAGRQPLAEILRQVLDDLGAWSGLAAWEGPGGVANARAYLDLLAAAESGLPEATFTKVDFRLPEAFQPPDPRAQDSPVDLLTVHGAKGLEFDRVFLPFLDWQPLGNKGRTPDPFLLEEIPGQGLHGLALARPYTHEKQSSLYVLLRNLRNRRILDEARRVFYVAVTRARQRLTLSGVVKQTGGSWPAAGESPLSWLGQHYRPESFPAGVPGVWPEPDLRVELFTAIPPLRGADRAVPELPAPWRFLPEAEPYRLSYPSQLAAEPLEVSPASGAGPAGDAARVRGEVTHRLLETLAQGEGLPPAASVAVALRREGLEPPEAARLAPEILLELEACLQDPFLARLLRPDLPVALNEWLLEDLPAPGTVRRGKIDRLVDDGEHWWILDYKTSRPEPGADWDGFIKQEVEKYRPQLLAYREMTARLKGLPPADIRLVLYFTGCQRSVEV
jgi:ATP-dependent helicase/nuclease subunit A